MKTEKEIVEAYLEALNHHDIDAVMALYDDDTVFEIADGDDVVGKSALRPFQEFYNALNSQWRWFDYVSEPGQVSCQGTMQNDFTRALGLDEMHYPSIKITLRDGLITSMRSEASQESMEQYKQADKAFEAWVTKEKPEALAELMPDKFTYSKESALSLMALLREWQAVQA